ncbi:imidazole glycerol phosphate synthase subunit HisH [Alphaproteobacteria bacterium]|nr:imidazole glycerol phosphate synthase subunit HisH [Alphaproteobacteria bacterium]
MSKNVLVLDFDCGNIDAVVNMFRRIGVNVFATREPSKIETATHVVLPGNGAFDDCIKNFEKAGFRAPLEKAIKEKNAPLLGICVGAQMLGNRSEEGSLPGLGWIDMEVCRFPNKRNLKVPHMGWNNVKTETNNVIGSAFDENARFYFSHSYYMRPVFEQNIFMKANHGQEFAAGVSKGNIIGVQFHPEKSHRFGKVLLNQFAEI